MRSWSRSFAIRAAAASRFRCCCWTWTIFGGSTTASASRSGDEVLRTLSAILRGRARRPRDLVARLGGDQFAVLLPETTPQSAAAIATTIHVDLANLATRPTKPASVAPFTASIGIHTAQPGEEITTEELFERADTALYQAKQQGRNRSFIYAGDGGSANDRG